MIKINKFVVFLILTTSFLIVVSSAFAIPPEDSILKVGFYPLKGFFEYDENGVEYGYGVDVLEEISRHCPYEFEYVRIFEWDD